MAVYAGANSKAQTPLPSYKKRRQQRKRSQQKSLRSL